MANHGELGYLELAWAEIDALALPVVQTRDLMLRMIINASLRVDPGDFWLGPHPTPLLGGR